jgi:predicted alpha/beta superfamily hydrolase
MRTLLLSFLVFVAIGWNSQHKKPLPRNDSDDKIIIDTIHSKILHEDRFVWIHVPSAILNSSKKYPVVFVFDAEANFDATKKILDNLNAESSSKPGADVILVGIDNIWLRYRDYSPSHIDQSRWVDKETAKATGGGPAFIAFLEKELLPYIEKTYPVSSNRTLIGHSMGGLQVINILLNHQQLFDNYIAIDPSLWWDDEKLLNESASILSDKVFERKSLFLAIANETEERMTIQQVKKDTSAKTILIRPSFSLAGFIETNKKNKLRFEWKFYQHEHHMTVNTPATYDGLEFILH